MTAFRFPRYREIVPNDLGFNAAAQNAAVTGSTFDAAGYDRLTLYCLFTRVAATGSVVLTIEAFNAALNDWVVLQAVETASGTATLTDLAPTKATGSATKKFEVRLKDLQFRKMRIKSAIVTGAGATDTLTIAGELQYMGG